MSDIKTRLSEIIADRSVRAEKIGVELKKWQEIRLQIKGTLDKFRRAEELNPDLSSEYSSVLDQALRKINGVIADYERELARFERKSLCIGIGGQARVGKSTFLQSVTGLGEDQIPTSDKFFTTAIRSRIENSREGVAIADFHSEESFLREVIHPICDKLHIAKPYSLDEFRREELSISPDEPQTQENDDLLKRLKDAQSGLDSYKCFLNGKCGERIELNDLRPYVAYPENGLKAGPYLAVSNLLIRAPFPSTDVTQLEVVDLPGLGEAGIDIAKIQTKGMENICDITLMMKRPTDTNVEWTRIDSNALDAMSAAVPLLKDQTKYTVILANVGHADNQRAEACIKSIRDNLKRPFKIVSCDAKNRDSIKSDTMPEILNFLAENLPIIDNAIIDGLNRNASAARESIKSDIDRIRKGCSKICGGSKQDYYEFYHNIHHKLAEVLEKIREIMKAKTLKPDMEWENEVDRIREEVKKWINNGCGYGSENALKDAITKEIRLKHSQPADVINGCRTKFREEWEKMDLHLENRIAKMLCDIMDSMKDVLNSFVPERKSNDLGSVRKQIMDFADRMESRPIYKEPGEEEALASLSNTLRRIAKFDLQFRFHLEPMLQAATRLLLANELPTTNDVNAAPKLFEELKKKLLCAADDYADGMKKSSSLSSAAIEKKIRLIKQSGISETMAKDIAAMLEQTASSAQSFCPVRIFASVIETFEDAFIRSKDAEKAISVIAREWENELRPTPDEKTRLMNEATGSLCSLKI